MFQKGYGSRPKPFAVVPAAQTIKASDVFCLSRMSNNSGHTFPAHFAQALPLAKRYSTGETSEFRIILIYRLQF